MKTKSLNTLKGEFSVWAKENRIEIFHGDDSSVLPSIVYSNKENNIESFRNLILKVSPPFLVIVANDIVIEARTYELNLNLFKQKDENFVRNYSLLNENKNDLSSIEIGFVYQGVFFYLIEYAEWYEEFEEIKELIKDTILGDEGNEDGEESGLTISDEEIDSVAREIACDNKYAKVSNRSQRESIAKAFAKKYFNEKGYDESALGVWKISRSAEEIFINEVKPKLEEEKSAELKTKVLDLKTKGLKKVQAAAKIGITLNVLNKYWESETV